MAKGAKDGETVTIKKYANRRLYNTGTSSYITLDDLAGMVREGVDFTVVDAKSGEDITHSILTQIIMEAEAGDKPMLPVSFLRDLIGMYGNSMQSVMPSYLEASMANFRKNQAKLASAIEKGIEGNPFAKIAETNIAMMKGVASALMPAKPSAGAAAPTENEDIAALRKQMAEMQAKLDKLDK